MQDPTSVVNSPVDQNPILVWQLIERLKESDTGAPVWLRIDGRLFPLDFVESVTRYRDDDTETTAFLVAGET
jgi:hypothetical protein